LDGLTNGERHPDNPFLRPDPGKWDGEGVDKPFVIFYHGNGYLWYNGRQGGLEQIGLAFHPGLDLGFPPVSHPSG
jgi:hypothetical protein